jgi:hypothetical protein
MFFILVSIFIFVFAPLSGPYGALAYSMSGMGNSEVELRLMIMNLIDKLDSDENSCSVQNTLSTHALNASRSALRDILLRQCQQDAEEYVFNMEDIRLMRVGYGDQVTFPCTWLGIDRVVKTSESCDYNSTSISGSEAWNNSEWADHFCQQGWTEGCFKGIKYELRNNHGIKSVLSDYVDGGDEDENMNVILTNSPTDPP